MMSKKADITVVILTYNEEVNLPHALDNVKEFAKMWCCSILIQLTTPRKSPKVMV